MIASPRALAAPFAVLSLLAIAAVPAIGQQAARKPAKVAVAKPAPVAATQSTIIDPATITVDTAPWLFKGSDIPPDPAWNFGALPNGLRYAVRKNGVPPGQVAVRVRIDAGSLNETDEERGYAHLIEHLSFRGSKYVPDGEAKRVWQRFGATFGSDSNASTTPTQTVYKLDLPAATEANLDESLKIFAGMMAEPGITAQGLAAERPAVLAEQREAPGPQVRLSDARNALFFSGQPLADRSPIGNVKTLEAATPESVLAFHRRWYRPARTVVIISGDIDPAIASQLVVKNFGGWQGTGPNPADPDFGKPDPKGTPTATLNEPSIPPLVISAVLRPWTYRDDTIIFNQKRLVDLVAIRVINRRLENRARAGGSFLQASVALEDVARSANGTFVSILPIGDDWEAALKDVRAVVADAIATAPSQAEVDREVAEFEGAMRNDVETARVEAGSKQADDMVQALDIRETVAGPQESYNIFLDAKKKGMFSAAGAFESTKRVFKGDAERAIVNTRVADPGAAAKLAAALTADVSNLAGRRASQAKVNFKDLPKLGKPGTVTSREAIADPGIEKVTFSNGVRMLMYPNVSETGRVYLRVRFGRGYGALPADRSTAAWAAESALVQSGIGKWNQGDLDALTTGRRMGLNFDVTDDAFVMNAMTTPGDYADNLALMAAKLAAPRWDAAPVLRAKAGALAGYAGFDSSPDGVLSRDLERKLRNGDPRWGPPTREEIEALTPEAFRKLWEPLLATGPIEVDVFGDVKADEAIAAVGRTFGALKPRTEAPVVAPGAAFPAHNDRPVVLTHEGADTQAAAVIAWPTGGGSAGIAESRRLDILAAIFGDRLFDRLRSVAGASYSPSAVSQWPLGLTSGGRIVAVGQVAPDNVDLFFKLSREIAAELVSTPVSEDELRRAIGPMMQYLARASSGNQFWLLQVSGGAYDPNRLGGARTLVSDYMEITPQTLQATAAKYLRPEKDWTLMVQPKAAAK
ncbi:M16 family metallopeptidase [Sphingomonas jeddahensis]|uniref:Peptidase M16 inactive domain protein n=1 Tax=Sphingomonas jeddahensis TaxID=1915074 RepID=A0A1V2EZB2_9SPHN|nr:M16 family metallopeptidase [Sphingomonas jeddahensis]ONF97494.1 Peptidase M16 inactive domain protein [Sphingomonas jeddahensis]